jgi:ABC-type spermidine/putrescine transport system permease subunit I
VDWFIYDEFGLTVALVAATLPFALFPTVIVGSSISETIWHASSDLGAKHHQEFFRIALPLMLPGVALGAVASFVVSTSSVCEAAFLGGPGQMTVGKVVSELEGARQLSTICALGTTNLCAVGFLMFILIQVMHKQKSLGLD